MMKCPILHSMCLHVEQSVLVHLQRQNDYASAILAIVKRVDSIGSCEILEESLALQRVVA